jgi:uncharacterized membrane protein
MINFKKPGILFTIIVVILFSLLIYFVNMKGGSSVQNTGTAYTNYEKAKVTKVVSESLEKDKNISGLYCGVQELAVTILTGEHKGETHTIKNYLSNTFNVYCKAGLKIIVCVDTAEPDNYQVTVYNYYREPLLYVFAFIFFALLYGIGGRKGLKSIAGLVFSMICILFLFIPMLYKGYSPTLASVVTVILTVCVAMLLLNGWSSRTLSSILGTALGVVIAGIVSGTAGALLHLSGLNSEEAEALILISYNTHMQVRGLLFAAILIASLGAIMDIAVSIASSVYEVYRTNTKLSPKALYASGLNIGRDMMGTMANTLILAFTGVSLNSLILIYSYNVPYRQLMNMNMIGMEIIQGLSGGLALILTVPIIAFISSRLIPLFHNKSKISH